MTAGINDFRTAAWAFPLGPRQHIQFGTMGQKADVTITLRALSGRFRLQATWTASLAEEVMPPAAEATTVFGPDVDGQADVFDTLKRRHFEQS